jgi:CHAT domain-containing protein/tetratricopeptide (TPR) repeat protein
MLLSLRGRASLLEWSYEAAITDLQQALDSEPQSVVIVNDLASAYFERAESEKTFSDYGTAFELQSHALQTQPDNAVVTFNRAITAERLFLFKQCFEDWEHYLRLDPSGEWAEEARERFIRAKGQFTAHERRIHQSLLTPAEFVQSVDPSNPQTWVRVEPRVEEYLTRAITDWLPRAFPADHKIPTSLDARRALATLAIILHKRHGDTWLGDALVSHPTIRFGEAVAALGRAFTADYVTEDYALGRKEAMLAARLFRREGNAPGVERAIFEEIYALHFSDLPGECLRQAATLFPLVAHRTYRWLQIQLRLEQAVCSNDESDLDQYGELATKAFHDANLACYPALALRALGFLSEHEASRGRTREAWDSYREGLHRYWAGSVPPMPGYNLYAQEDYAVERSQYWHLNVAVDEQALTLIDSQNAIMRAVEHTRLAHAAEKAGAPRTAEENLTIASRLLASAAQTDVTENYRLGIEVDMARIEGQIGQSQRGLDRLSVLRTRLVKMPTQPMLAEYYRAEGELQVLSHRKYAAEEAFQVAVALAERERSSLRSEDDRITWAHESSRSYRQLVESKINLHSPLEALGIWELYRGVALRSGASSAGQTQTSGADPESSSTSLQQTLVAETDLVKRTLPSLTDRTVLVYSLLSRGLAIWAYDDRGIRSIWIEKDPAYIRLLSRRFAELCDTPSSSLTAFESTAQELYELLIAPVSDHLRPQQTLVIEVDEDLAAIPFQALINTNGHYLIDEYPIVYSPGLRYMAQLPTGDARFRLGMGALIVASSAGGPEAGLRPLADAVLEAHAVAGHSPGARLLIDNQATLAAVKSELSHATSFHFAGHAGRRRERTGLFLFSDTEREKTIVFDSSLLEGTSMPALRMAVLSACSTEKGEEGSALDSGSLVRAFLRVGVPHVVASRWDVDSGSSSALMQAFYDAMLLGRTPAQALATAEIQMRRRAVHPYYWAGFDAFGQ